MFQDLNIFLGAVVADAAARPLHWVYDPKKLKRYIKQLGEVVVYYREVTINDKSD